MRKKLSFLKICLLCALLCLFSVHAEAAPEEEGWHTLLFGRYEQDNNLDNGPEPVTWIILDQRDGQVLLLSLYGLEARRFHGRDVSVQWEDCDLRAWMNTEMLSALFTPEEQKAVRLTHLVAEPNPRYDTPYGGDTDDWLFPLSVQEIERYFPTEASRTAQPTPYALSTHAHLEKNGNTGWWTRTTGHSTDDEARVSSTGRFINFQVNWWQDTVRPALWADLSLIPQNP